jgi:thiol-disulfide isomerase/thioredoxin
VQCYAFSDLVNFNALDLCYIPEYRDFVNSFIINELGVRRQRTQTPFSWSEIVESAMRLIDELSFDVEAREGIKAVFLAYVTDEIERDKITAAAMDVLSCLEKIEHPSSKAFRELEARLITVIRENRFNKGSPAPEFELVDTLGNVMTLHSFQGKKIIIDVAASWCGPCIAAIPQWNAMVEANTDPGVVYVFLSLDDTTEKWHRFIQKYEIEGLLLFAGNGGFKSKFARDYELRSLPHQIVIDKAGNIESYKRY